MALELNYNTRAVPFGPLVAAKLTGLAVNAQEDASLKAGAPPVLTLSSKDVLSGNTTILRFIARSAKSETTLYGGDALASVHVDEVLDFSCLLAPGPGFETVCNRLNDYLSLRTYFGNNTLTIGDLAVWGTLQTLPIWAKFQKSPALPHLIRWYDHCCSLPDVAEVIDAYDARKKRHTQMVAKSTQKSGTGSSVAGELQLPGAVVGKVVTRFPPEPSGYLHIGHAKAAMLNYHFARQYKGKLIVRFDDTNPSKEKDEFVENILADIATLGISYDRLTYTSDYFDLLMEQAELLIKSELLYADDTPVEQMREERMAMIESKCRSRTVEENLQIWKEMVAGSEVGQLNCIRFKLNMQDNNGCMRDPVAYRCNMTPHHRTGTKYKVYPTYDCACPFVDAHEGVTHALRTSEYKDREAQYYWILEAHQKVRKQLPKVQIWDYARLSFQYTVLSKRKLTWFVDTGRVDGWNDPRFPTVQGIIRRGMTVPALQEFMVSQGASKNVTLQEWDKIWSINKRIIDPVCPRHTAIATEGRVCLQLTNVPAEPEVMIVPRHKKCPAAGQKATVKMSRVLMEQVDAQAVSEGEEVTLMDWGNCFIRKISKGANGVVTALEGELNPQGDFKKTKLKLTWLADMGELVDLQLLEFAQLITKAKPEEDDNLEDLVNPHTKFEFTAQGDPNMRTLQKGDIIQLERKGYFIVDAPLLKAGKPMVLLSIPDGKAAKK
eukprot:CAMPEP_0117656620 /NCGR_PEP_ID=MMETSP0804-20121206/4900_1 /TAXON_ID=1074897 /ORGANISM="Tetraselmis astigmatica, Strain CCMP880" /LENGTH=718 /DNA_ID=CAMNT_0005463031 /DNA_START=7 /DNA_END=2163 /DNA_ORIENTATION=-